MFKLVIVSALFAVAVAKPSGWHAPAHVVHSVAPSHISYEHVHGVQEVGKIVEHIPTSVSHSSSSVVHDTVAHVTPILHKSAPVVVHHAAPVVHHHHAEPAIIAHHAAPAHVSYEHVHGVHEVAKYVQHVPTSVSHSSSSVVHSHGALVQPIIAPVVHHHAVPVVSHAVWSDHAPVVHGVSHW